MKLKRQVVNGQVIYRNAETDEIVKTESANNEEKSVPSAPSHTSVLASIITIIGVILLFVSAIFIIAGLGSPLLGVATIPTGIGIFISAIMFFAVAEIVDNLQYQTKLLKKLLEN